MTKSRDISICSTHHSSVSIVLLCTGVLVFFCFVFFKPLIDVVPHHITPFAHGFLSEVLLACWTTPLSNLVVRPILICHPRKPLSFWWICVESDSKLPKDSPWSLVTCVSSRHLLRWPFNTRIHFEGCQSQLYTTRTSYCLKFYCSIQPYNNSGQYRHFQETCLYWTFVLKWLICLTQDITFQFDQQRVLIKFRNCIFHCSPRKTKKQDPKRNWWRSLQQRWVTNIKKIKKINILKRSERINTQKKT